MPTPLFPPLRLTKPGLFITATDTDVGKTVTACAIAWALRRQWPACRLGVCKPLATGCRREREGLVSSDAEALAHFADCRQPLDIINPIRFARPLAPAVAAELAHTTPDFSALARALEILDQTSDALLIEGIGGLLVPIDPQDPSRTLLDLIQLLDYPVLVVCRPALGTLNHTAMTVRLLRQADCRVAGLVINGYVPDSSTDPDKVRDLAMFTNPSWLNRMTGLPILATLPFCPSDQVQPQAARLPQEILDAALTCFWPQLLKPPRPIASG